MADKSFPDSGLPVAEILVLAGFLIIYLVEELMHFVLVKYGNLGRPVLRLQSGHSLTLFILQKTRVLRNTQVEVMVTPMTTSSSQLRRDFRSSVDSGASTCNSLLQKYFAIFSYQAAARGFLVVLALSIHDLFEGLLISNFWTCQVSRLQIYTRGRSGCGQAPVLRLVPPARLRLSQVGHLRLSGTEVGQVCGKSTIK